MYDHKIISRVLANGIIYIKVFGGVCLSPETMVAVVWDARHLI